MTIFGMLLLIVLTMLPGWLIVRLIKGSDGWSKLLYAFGIGLMFNLSVGMIANYISGINLVSVLSVYVAMAVILGLLSWKCGHETKFMFNKKEFLISAIIFVVALVLQYQTTLMSPNLVGSDIHLEYFQANQILRNGYWDATEIGSAINTCLGIVVLLPVIKLLTGLEMISVFQVINPLIFAVLPLVLYVIYRRQFGSIIAVLAVIFFMTMPMFTMDMTQLVRQQQSEIFFILIIYLVLDDKISTMPKIVLGSLFGIGAVVTHYGLSLGLIGYFLIGSLIILALHRYWKRKEFEDSHNLLLPRLAMGLIAVISILVYVGYYAVVSKGEVLAVGIIPLSVVTDTTHQVVSGISEGGIVAPMQQKFIGLEEGEKPALNNDYHAPQFDNEIFKRFPFLNPLLREPILQTAIGLDFGRASLLGKVWRVLQYLVELCLLIGFFVFLFKPSNKIKLEYYAFVITSILIVAGMYLLTTYSYGMGATRVWEVTLLFMSPLFVIGASSIGRLLMGFVKINQNKIVLCSTLVPFIPYALFNLGVPFEVAKLQPVGFIDVPYSVALSGHRVDIATVFEKEDIEALDWLEQYKNSIEDESILYGDTHVARLMAQRFGWYYMNNEKNEFYIVGNIRSLEYIRLRKDDKGIVFLSKRNVGTHTVTYQAEYASRKTYSIDDLPELKKFLANGEVVFDNGARIIKLGG